MKRFVPLVLMILALAAPPVHAQTPESTTQMQLASSPVFITRLQYLMGQQARTVLSEASGGSCYALRQTYAAQVIADSRQKAVFAAPIVVGGVNLINETITGSAPDFDTTATDAEILSQVSTFWSALSQCSTPS